MNLTAEQKQRMRKALVGIGIMPVMIERKDKTLVYHVNNWCNRYGDYDIVCELLEIAAKHNVLGYNPFYAFADKLSKQWATEKRVIQEVEKYRIDPNDPETKEWLRRQQRGRTSPQDGQAPKRVESRIMDRPLPNCGEVLQGPEQGGQGKVVGTDGNNGFIPAKRRQK